MDKKLTHHVLLILVLLSVCAAPAAQTACRISGKVTDQFGMAVRGASVVLLSEVDGGQRSAETDDEGGFAFSNLAAGRYTISVEKAGFKPARGAVRLGPADATSADFRLEVGDIKEELTVTAARGEAQHVFGTPESVSVVTEEEIRLRPALLLPQALRGEPGVHVQQTTTAQGSPFVRGLTGQQVVALVNGVRFNNSTFRPGANQYTAFVEPSFVERVEVVRGPNSTQHGSDSLGGTINALTRPAPARGASGPHGGFNTFFAGADLSAGGAAHLSGGGRRWSFLAGGSGHRAQDLRAGGGLDSHSVVTRLLGLPAGAPGGRLQDTGYSQYGVNAKLALDLTRRDALSFEYVRGAQLGVRRYDQLDGGLGNLLSSFDPQTLDLFVARYDRAGLGFLDALSATFSFNGQRDDRTSQSINNARTGLLSKITGEYNRTNVFGYQAQGVTRVGRRHSVAFGGEFYDEYVSSRRVEMSFSRANGGFTDRADVRARFPDGARYKTFGLFLQDVATLVEHRLTGSFGLRHSRFAYSQSPDGNPRDAAGAPTVPRFETSFGDVTFNAGLAYSVNSHLNLTANVSRGFRAPNVNDFGSIGLSGLGFEVSPEEGARLGGTVGNFDPSAPSAGEPVRQLKAEQLYSFEVGARLRTNRLSGAVSLFDSEIFDFIERRVLVLPAGAVGRSVGGQSVVRQDATGAVFTALSNSPVFVRANASRLRLRGFEAEFSLRLPRDLTLAANAFTVRGEDLERRAPPSVENGIPPASGWAGLRWEPRGRRFWAEVYTHFADAQRRLSDNDFQQARIGGVRTRDEIANFFNNGAAARGLVRGGRLLVTGETLAQVQQRVLGPAARSPLFNKNPGYATLNLRGAYRLGEASAFTFILENVLDKNYRPMGSGVDAPGVNAVARYSYSF